MDKWINKFVHTVVDFDTIFFGGGGGEGALIVSSGTELHCSLYSSERYILTTIT